MVEKAKEEKKRKVLVTGSSGMLGSDLCEELSRDYEIIGLDVHQLSAIGFMVPCYHVRPGFTGWRHNDPDSSGTLA